MSDLHAVIQQLLSKRFGDNATEIARRLTILRPLWDEEHAGRLSAASEISGDSMIRPLETALNRNDIVDMRIVTVSIRALMPETLQFATKRANEDHAIRSRASAYQALRASTEENVIQLLHASIPGGILKLPKELLSTPDLTMLRYQAVSACLEHGSDMTAESIRSALLLTYLECSLDKDMMGVANRIERICEIASTKAVPYGIRKRDEGDKKTAFLFITG